MLAQGRYRCLSHHGKTTFTKTKLKEKTCVKGQTSLAVSIMISVCSLVSSCSDTSVDVTLLVCSVLTSWRSSSREPLVSFNNLHTEQEEVVEEVDGRGGSGRGRRGEGVWEGKEERVGVR